VKLAADLHSSLFGSSRTLAMHSILLIGSADGRVSFTDIDEISSEPIFSVVINLNVGVFFSL